MIGRRLTMHEDGATYTVVGVMPQGMDPRGTVRTAPAIALRAN